MKITGFILGLFFAVGLLVFPQKQAEGQVDGAFYGYVIYRGEYCHCVYVPAHRVAITKDGGATDYHRVKCGSTPGYATTGYSYTAGWYTFQVQFDQSNQCYLSVVKRVYYDGMGGMQVDLNVYGDEGTPEGGNPGP